jgi:heme-degrading monooxygenase HmoA
MITRIWRGWTDRGNAAAYQTLLQTKILPGIAGRRIKGYRGARVLRRESGGEVEFMTVLQFDSADAVREFAGGDYEAAVVPAEARALLARFDERAAHYETLAETRGDARLDLFAAAGGGCGADDRNA